VHGFDRPFSIYQHFILATAKLFTPAPTLTLIPALTILWK